MILFLVVLRIREAGRIRRKFPRGEVVRTSFAVTYYGLDSEPGGLKRSLGALALLTDGLYFRARVGSQELTIPRASILHIGVSNTHKGRTLRQYAVAVRFLNAAGRGDTAAFRFPLSARWVSDLKATLIGGRAQSSAPPEPDGSPPSNGGSG